MPDLPKRQPTFLYNGHLFDLIWIWSEVLHPQDRFCDTDHPLVAHGYSIRCTLSDEVVRYRLREALTREMELEAYLTDPQEWPSPYWLAKSDLVDLYV